MLFMRMLSVGYLSVDCLSQPKSGTHGLRQHRSCGLVEDLQLGQLGRFKGKVCVLNTASGSRQVGRDVGQIVDRVAQPVENSAKLRALDFHRCDGSVKLSRCRPSGVSWCKRHGRGCGNGFSRIDVAGITPAKH